MLVANEKIKLGSSQLKLKAVLSFAIRQHPGPTSAPLSIGRPSPNHDKRLVSLHWFDQPAGTSPLVIEVVTFFEVRDQCGVHWPPPQQLAGQRARRRVVSREEGP